MSIINDDIVGVMAAQKENYNQTVSENIELQMSKLRLEDGDLLIVKIPRTTPMEKHQILCDALNNIFAYHGYKARNIHWFVISEDVNLSVAEPPKESLRLIRLEDER